MERVFLEELVGDEAAVDAILQAHETELRQQDFRHGLERAVSDAGGRNLTAIRALLDEQALFASEHPDKAVQEAIRKLKKDSPYLFENRVSQPYAAGVPAQMGEASMEDLGAMTMAEYRRFRRGR